MSAPVGPTATPAAAPEPNRARGSYGRSLALLAGGAGLAFIGFGQTWVTVTGRQPGLPAASLALAGRDLAAVAGATPALLIVLVLALTVTGGQIRRVIGALALLLSALVAVAAIRGSGPLLPNDLGVRFNVAGAASYTTTWWWLPSLLGAVIAGYGGLVAWRYGATWVGMSGRYRRGPAVAPVATGPLTEREAWDVLDSGEDPTERQVSAGEPPADPPVAGADTMSAESDHPVPDLRAMDRTEEELR
jgi:hypothetical protein